MSRPGQPPTGFGQPPTGFGQPFGFGNPPQPPRHVRPQPPETVRVDGLRQSLRRSDRRLVTVNGACFVLLVALSGAAPGLLATELVGRINLGMLLMGALGVLTLCTTIAYDRRLEREHDPEADRIKARLEERERAAAAGADTWNQNPARGRAEW